MKKEQIDVTQDVGLAAASPEHLMKISAAALRLKQNSEDIAKLQKTIEDLVQANNQIQFETLPELMQQVSMKSFQLEDGSSIDIKPIVRGSIPSTSAIEDCGDPLERGILVSRRKQCMAWLRKVRADGLIKNKLTVEFSKGQDALAREAEKLMKKLKVPFKLDPSVHPSTLAAFLREQVEAGKEPPQEPFQLFVGKKAELKAPKKPTQEKQAAISAQKRMAAEATKEGW